MSGVVDTPMPDASARQKALADSQPEGQPPAKAPNQTGLTDQTRQLTLNGGAGGNGAGTSAETESAAPAHVLVVRPRARDGKTAPTALTHAECVDVIKHSAWLDSELNASDKETNHRYATNYEGHTSPSTWLQTMRYVAETNPRLPGTVYESGFPQSASILPASHAHSVVLRRVSCPPAAPGPARDAAKEALAREVSDALDQSLHGEAVASVDVRWFNNADQPSYLVVEFTSRVYMYVCLALVNLPRRAVTERWTVDVYTPRALTSRPDLTAVWITCLPSAPPFLRAAFKAGTSLRVRKAMWRRHVLEVYMASGAGDAVCQAMRELDFDAIELLFSSVWSDGILLYCSTRTARLSKEMLERGYKDYTALHVRVVAYSDASKVVNWEEEHKRVMAAKGDVSSLPATLAKKPFAVGLLVAPHCAYHMEGPTLSAFVLARAAGYAGAVAPGDAGHFRLPSFSGQGTEELFMMKQGVDSAELVQAMCMRSGSIPVYAPPAMASQSDISISFDRVLSRLQSCTVLDADTYRAVMASVAPSWLELPYPLFAFPAKPASDTMGLGADCYKYVMHPRYTEMLLKALTNKTTLKDCFEHAQESGGPQASGSGLMLRLQHGGSHKRKPAQQEQKQAGKQVKPNRAPTFTRR